MDNQLILTEELQKDITRGLQFLAGICDFAHKHDGEGFSAFDADIGHSLASQAPNLSDKQFSFAAGMIYKYRRQLSTIGVEFPKISNGKKSPKTEIIVERKTPYSNGKEEKKDRIFILDGKILIDFVGIPSEAIRKKLKEVRGWIWHSERVNKEWSLPALPSNSAYIIDLLPTAEFSDEVSALGKNAKIIPPPEKQPDVIIKLVSENIRIFFPNHETRKALLIKARNLPQRKFQDNKDGKYWEVPFLFINEILETFPNVSIDQDIKDKLSRQESLKEKSNNASSDFEVDGLNGELFPFQKAGIEFSHLSDHRCIIADDMGLGKTIQVIGCLQQRQDIRPAIIVVPSSVKINWKKEMEEWLTTGEQIIILKGKTPFKLTGIESIIVINYDILSFWIDELISLKPQLLIGDEAHYIKNFKGMGKKIKNEDGTITRKTSSPKRSIAFVKLAKIIKHVILLTGTPITNRTIELWPLLYCIDPETWNNRFQFALRYSKAFKTRYGWDMTGASNLDELHEKTKSFIIRRTKEQVLSDLPPKRNSKIFVEFSGDAKKEYDILIESAIIEMEKGKSAAALTFIEEAKQVTARAKMGAVIEWINDFLVSGEKLVIFATHHEIIDMILKEFPKNSVEYTGRTSEKKKDEAITKFQNDPKIKLFVGNIKAAGLGITLTAASNALFIEYPWTPGDYQQASDRIYRIGQEAESVNIWSLVADDTIDSTIIDLLQGKREIISEAIDGKELNESMIGELIGSIKSK